MRLVDKVKTRISEFSKNNPKTKEVLEATAHLQKLTTTKTRRMSRMAQRAIRAMSMNKKAAPRVAAIGHMSGLKGKKYESISHHSRSFIDSLIEARVLHGDEVNFRKIVEAKADLTSTSVGHFAIAALSAITESKDAFSAFIDLEIVEGSPVFYFGKPVTGLNLKEAVSKALENFGEITVLVGFGDNISEGFKSDVMAITLPVTNEKIDASLDAGVQSASDTSDQEVAESIEAVEKSIEENA